MSSLKEIIDFYKQIDNPSDFISKDFTIIQNSLPSYYFGGRLVFTDGIYVYKVLSTKSILKSETILEFFKQRNIDEFLVPFHIIYLGKHVSIIAQKKVGLLNSDGNSFKIDSNILNQFENYNIPTPIKKHIINDYPDKYDEIFTGLKLFHIKDATKNNCGLQSGKIVLFDYEIHEKLTKDDIQIIISELSKQENLIIQFLESLQ